jgi:phosphatidylglycerophosphate synthase
VILVLGAIQVHEPAPWALIALVAARELVVIPLAAAYRLIAPSRMPHAFKAGLLGKAATIAELCAIAALIMRAFAAGPATAAAWLFASLAATLGVGAVGTYVARSLRAAPAV